MYYVLSAGTNLGDRLANLTYCREALDLVPGTHVVSASAVYQTQPVGYARQDDFYNVCFLVESRLNMRCWACAWDWRPVWAGCAG